MVLAVFFGGKGVRKNDRKTTFRAVDRPTTSKKMAMPFVCWCATRSGRPPGTDRNNVPIYIVLPHVIGVLAD
jgi:hypothetical protein